MFALTLRQADHERRYSIVRTGVARAGKYGSRRIRSCSGSTTIRTGTGWSARSRCSSVKRWQLQESGWRMIRETSVDEPIAEADDGLDLPAGLAELAAQPADVHVHRARLDQAIVAPHALEQPVA